MESEKENRGYAIIELPIFEPLNWKMDDIVACLEILRKKLPVEFKEFPESM